MFQCFWELAALPCLTHFIPRRQDGQGGCSTLCFSQWETRDVLRRGEHVEKLAFPVSPPSIVADRILQAQSLVGGPRRE